MPDETHGHGGKKCATARVSRRACFFPCVSFHYFCIKEIFREFLLYQKMADETRGHVGKKCATAPVSLRKYLCPCVSFHYFGQSQKIADETRGNATGPRLPRARFASCLLFWVGGYLHCSQCSYPRQRHSLWHHFLRASKSAKGAPATHSGAATNGGRRCAPSAATVLLLREEDRAPHLGRPPGFSLGSRTPRPPMNRLPPGRTWSGDSSGAGGLAPFRARFSLLLGGPWFISETLQKLHE